MPVPHLLLRRVAHLILKVIKKRAVDLLLKERKGRMSQWTIEQLEKAVEDGRFVKKELTLVTYTEKAKPFNVKKVCPFCKKPFDLYLHCEGPLIGCNTCATKNALRTGIEIGKDKLEEIKDTLKNV